MLVLSVFVEASPSWIRKAKHNDHDTTTVMKNTNKIMDHANDQDEGEDFDDNDHN